MGTGNVLPNRSKSVRAVYKPKFQVIFEILKKYLQANMRAMPKTKDPWEQIFLKCCHPFDKCLKYTILSLLPLNF
jgi:hypothetical protein